MEIRIANPTMSGGEVQLWPMEWQALIAVLPKVQRGNTLVPIIRTHLATPTTKPVRIPLSSGQIEVIEAAAARLG